MTATQALPDLGLLTIYNIVGGGKKNATPIIPVCKKTWLNGVKEGIYPKPIRISKRRVAWKAEDIRQLVESMEVVA